MMMSICVHRCTSTLEPQQDPHALPLTSWAPPQRGHHLAGVAHLEARRGLALVAPRRSRLAALPKQLLLHDAHQRLARGTHHAHLVVIRRSMYEERQGFTLI